MALSSSIKRRSLPLYVLIASIVLSVIILSYVAYRQSQSDNKVIGKAFIDTEIPAPTSFPFFLKPITWLMIFMIAGWMAFLELVREKIRLLTANWRFLYKLLLFLITALTLYETIYNFTLWGSILSRERSGVIHPDDAINAFPTEMYQTSLVFATKIAITILVCGLYALYVFRERNPLRRY